MDDIEEYNVRIEWWEDDFTGEDQISQPMVIHPKTGRFSFSQSGALNGDEIFSAGYKPRAVISHDCTDDRKRVDLELTVTTLCEMGHRCHYRIIEDLTNHWGNYEIKPAAFIHDSMDPFPDFP